MSETLNALYDEMRAEAQKNEHTKARVIVVGEGNTSPSLLLIGEAPGGDEERLVRPFVGKAGKNLDEFLEILGQKREDIYITNLVKVRPTRPSAVTGERCNRPPDNEEIDFFKPYLEREIEILAPKLIVSLGNFSLKALLRDERASIGKLHGQSIVFNKTNRLFPLYHPAAIIYNQSLKQPYLDDLQKLKRMIERMENLTND